VVVVVLELVVDDVVEVGRVVVVGASASGTAGSSM
jgi:hypothetical protein